jgi:hypothetical protein
MIRNKIKGKVEAWENRSLTLASRNLYIISILSAISIFLNSIIMVPKRVIVET